MLDSLYSQARALWSAPAFKKLLEGTSLQVPNIGEVDCQLTTLTRRRQPRGYRFAPHSFAATLRVGGEVAIGYGEADSALLAAQKAVAEAMERALFYLTSPHHQSISTNGWAAHLSPALVESTAISELAERDAMLSHWLTEKPLIEAAPRSLPKWLLDWAQDELSLSPYPRLKVGVTSLGYMPVAVVAFSNSSGFAVISQATAKTLNCAVAKALAEVCRIAALCTRDDQKQLAKELITPIKKQTIQPEHHAAFYAGVSPLPTWLFRSKKTWEELAKSWHKRVRAFYRSQLDYTFHLVCNGPLAVGYCESPKVQNLFFGRTPDAIIRGEINIERIRIIKPSGPINLMPHCVA